MAAKSHASVAALHILVGEGWAPLEYLKATHVVVQTVSTKMLGHSGGKWVHGSARNDPA